MGALLPAPFLIFTIRISGAAVAGPLFNPQGVGQIFCSTNKSHVMMCFLSETWEPTQMAAAPYVLAHYNIIRHSHNSGRSRLVPYPTSHPRARSAAVHPHRSAMCVEFTAFSYLYHFRLKANNVPRGVLKRDLITLCIAVWEASVGP